MDGSVRDGKQVRQLGATVPEQWRADGNCNINLNTTGARLGFLNSVHSNRVTNLLPSPSGRRRRIEGSRDNNTRIPRDQECEFERWLQGGFMNNPPARQLSVVEQTVLAGPTMATAKALSERTSYSLVATALDVATYLGRRTEYQATSTRNRRLDRALPTPVTMANPKPEAAPNATIVSHEPVHLNDSRLTVLAVVSGFVSKDDGSC